MSSIPDAHDVRQHADDLFTPATDLAPDSSPAIPFTEAQARAWLDANGQQSIRLTAKLFGWHPSRVKRFLDRAGRETAPETVSETPASVSAETPAVSSETPPLFRETPETPDEAGFDYRRAECVLPMHTSVWAYVDQATGDLWISASDPLRRCDTELRINAEDVAEFVDRLVELVQPAHRGATNDT
jgi:hypothetical protein